MITLLKRSGNRFLNREWEEDQGIFPIENPTATDGQELEQQDQAWDKNRRDVFGTPHELKTSEKGGQENDIERDLHKEQDHQDQDQKS